MPSKTDDTQHRDASVRRCHDVNQSDNDCFLCVSMCLCVCVCVWIIESTRNHPFAMYRVYTIIIIMTATVWAT